MTRRTPSIGLLAATLAFVLALAAPPAPARAYVVLTTDGFDRFRWPAGAPVAWTIEPGALDGLSPESIAAALRASFATWEAVDCATLRFAFAGTADNVEDGRIHIRFEREEWDPTTGDAAAITETFRNRNDEIVRAEMRFNGVDMRWSVGVGDPYAANQVDVQAVATHELGHAFGLSHSRERAAAMFFAGGDVGSRGLDDDDRRGVCYLYPAVPFASGRPCDTCDLQVHCAAGACLYFPDEGGFCGATCATDADCPPHHACSEIAGVGRQCLPGSGHCAEAGGDIPTGEYCYGDVTCASGVCLVTPGDAFCTAGCGQSGDAPCPNGSRCLDTGLGRGFCVLPGSRPFGARCASHTDCEDMLCVEALDGGVCTATCATEADCPNGAPCVSEACVAAGPRPIGAACASHFDCAHGVCLLPRGDPPFCSVECDGSAAPCPDGSLCLDFGEKGFCKTAGNQPEGGLCLTDAGCRDDLACQPGSASGAWWSCVRPCDPVAADGCRSNEVCAWSPAVADATGGPTTVGHCAPDAGAGRDEACGPDAEPCRADLVCVLDGARAGRCRPSCAVSSRAPCGATERCVALGARAPATRGVCLTTADDDAVAVWWPGDSLPAVDSTEPPAVASALVPIEDAEPPSSGGGCALSGRSVAPAALDTPAAPVLPWLLFVLLLFVLLLNVFGVGLWRRRSAA